MAARRPDQPDYMRTPQGSQPPALTHHHSMSNPMSASMPQPPHSIAPHPASGRPGLDRAHTFPTPPASASSLTMGMGNAGSSYEYSGGHAGTMNSGQPLSIDTGMSARTLPTSPATTPPGTTQGMQYQTSQPYDSTRPMYSQPTYSQYSQSGLPRYGGVQSSPSTVKHEMGPPARAGAENEHPDSKPHDGYGGQQDADGEHEGEYTHTSSASYGARRASYSYKPNSTLGPVHSDPAHISPEMTHSPHQNGSGRATPRTTTTYTGYSTPHRASQLPSSNLNYVMSNDTRAGAQQNGTDPYGAPSAYQPQQYPSMNGAPPSNKRGREDDQEDPYGRPLSASGDASLKRQRTDAGAMRPISQPHTVKAGGMRR